MNFFLLIWYAKILSIFLFFLKEQYLLFDKKKETRRAVQVHACAHTKIIMTVVA